MVNLFLATNKFWQKFSPLGPGLSSKVILSVTWGDLNYLPAKSVHKATVFASDPDWIYFIDVPLKNKTGEKSYFRSRRREFIFTSLFFYN